MRTSAVTTTEDRTATTNTASGPFTVSTFSATRMRNLDVEEEEKVESFLQLCPDPNRVEVTAHVVDGTSHNSNFSSFCKATMAGPSTRQHSPVAKSGKEPRSKNRTRGGEEPERDDTRTWYSRLESFTAISMKSRWRPSTPSTTRASRILGLRREESLCF